MDLILLINDQKRRLTRPNSYFDELWENIIHGTENDEASSQSKETFEYHLPVNLQGFFDTCIRKTKQLLNHSSTLDWENLDHSYLCVIIHSAITQTNTTDNFVPLSAARLYLMLNSLSHSDRMFYRTIFRAVLSTLDTYLPTENASTHVQKLLVYLKLFLQNNSLRESLIIETTSVLYKVISLDSVQTLDHFDVDAPFVNVQHTALVCCKLLLQKLDRRRESDKKVMLHVLFTLTNTLSSSQVRSRRREAIETLHANVRAFLKDSAPRLLSTDGSLVSSVVKTLATQPGFDLYDQMVLIMCDTDDRVYCNFAWWVIEGLVCNQEQYRRSLPSLAVSLVQFPPRNQAPQKREAMLEVLLTNMMKLCGDKSYEIKENAFRCLDAIVCVDEASLRNVIMSVVHENHSVFMDVCKRQLDVKWKKKVINRCFISIICRLALHSDILTDETVEILNSLLADACPMDVRPVIGKVADLIRRNSSQSNVVLTGLNLLVRMVLNLEAISNYYSKVLHDLLFEAVEINSDSGGCLNIADVLISKTFDHVAVFKKFHTLNLLSPWKLKVLIEHKIMQNPKALKLLCAVLGFLRYDKFGSLIEFTDIFFQELTFQHGSLIFFAINKILSQKDARKCTPGETRYIKKLQFYLEHNIETKMIPIHCITNAISLLVNLGSFSLGNVSLEHILRDLSRSLHQKLIRIHEGSAVESFEICRDSLYVGDLLLQTDLNLDANVAVTLRNLLKSSNPVHEAFLNNNPKIWSFLITLHTKMSIKNKDFAEENIAILEKSLACEQEEVRYHALRAMEDVCSVQLNYFEPLVPWAFEFISANNESYLTLICLKIIHKLVCEDYVILNESQYIAVSALLGHKNEWIRRRVAGLLKENFLQKCQPTIAAYFVPSIVYYNNYSNHDVYFVDAGANTRNSLTRHQRSRVYRYFFTHLPKNVQFNVISDMTVQILEKILKGKLPNSLDLLLDCLSITNVIADQSETKPNERRMVYKRTVKEIQNNILYRYYDDTKSTSTPHQLQIIRKFMLVFLRLTFRIKIVDEGLRKEILHSDLVLTDVYFPDIQQICKDGCDDLRKLYRELLKYYEKYKHVLDYQEVDEVAEVSVVLEAPMASTSNADVVVQSCFVDGCL